MANWYWKLEIDDNLGANFVIDSELREFVLKLGRYNYSSLEYVVRSKNNINTKIVAGKEVRVYGDPSPSPTTRQFTGVNRDKNNTGTYQEYITVYVRDLFLDRRRSRSINKKYADQEVSTSIIDMINNFSGGGFTTTGVQTLGISQPYNFVAEQLEHAFDRIEESSFSELFMKANKDMVFRYRETEDSGITLTDANLFEPENIEVKRATSESFEICQVVGGLDGSGKRVLAEARVPKPAATIQDRTYPHVDERFTTWAGAKEKALTMVSELGKEFFMLPNSILVKDLSSLPRPGTMININSTTLAITNVKFRIEEIIIHQLEGEDSTEFIEMKLGETEEDDIETLRILQQLWESEKRKDLDADAITNQSFFSVPILFAPTLTLTVTGRDTAINPYVWSLDSDAAADRSEWGASTWA